MTNTIQPWKTLESTMAFDELVRLRKDRVELRDGNVLDDTSQVERDHKRGHEIRNSKRIHHHPNGSNKPD